MLGSGPKTGIWGTAMARKWMHLLGAGCFAALSTPAMAELSFCNETDLNASIAIGYLAGDKWTSEGWWTAGPGQCVTTVDAPAPQAYYYWHAVNENGEFASDAYFFCAVDEVFTIIGDEDCAARGHDRLAFNEVQIAADGTQQVRLTAALAPKAAPARKTAEPVSEPDVEPAVAEPLSEPVPEASPDPAPASLPKPTLSLSKDIATADLLTTWPLDFPAIKTALQGDWVQTDNPAMSSAIGGNRFDDFENGTPTASGAWRLAATCPGGAGEGPAIVLRYDDRPEDALCVILQALDDGAFTLRDPRDGLLIRYTR